MSEMHYNGVQCVVQVSSDVTEGCPVCQKASIGGQILAPSINHLIEVHGYTLLFIGEQTEWVSDTDLWHRTVAILGRQAVPEQAPPLRGEKRPLPDRTPQTAA